MRSDPGVPDEVCTGITGAEKQMQIFENGNEILQPLLDRGGTVDITEPGVYMVGKPLIIGSDTVLHLRAGVTVKAKDMSRCSLLENGSFTQNTYDRNIEIIGGIWDGNCDRQGIEPVSFAKDRNMYAYDPHRFTGKLLRFAHVHGLIIRDAVIRDPVSYGIQIADTENFAVSDIHFDYNCHYGLTDGVHINGPAAHGMIRRVHGITNDDMVSLTPSDENHAEVTRGAISDVVIDGVHAENGYTGVRLLSSGDPLTDITVRNVSGTYRHNAVCLTHHNIHPGEPIWMDHILIDGVDASRSPWGLTNDCFTWWETGAFDGCPMVWVAEGVRIGTLAIRNVRRQEMTVSQARTVQIDREAVIDRLTVSALSHHFLHGKKIPVLSVEGTVKELSVE